MNTTTQESSLKASDPNLTHARINSRSALEIPAEGFNAWITRENPEVLTCMLENWLRNNDDQSLKTFLKFYADNSSQLDNAVKTKIALATYTAYCSWFADQSVKYNQIFQYDNHKSTVALSNGVIPGFFEKEQIIVKLIVGDLSAGSSNEAIARVFNDLTITRDLSDSITRLKTDGIETSFLIRQINILSSKFRIAFLSVGALLKTKEIEKEHEANELGLKLLKQLWDLKGFWDLYDRLASLSSFVRERMSDSVRVNSPRALNFCLVASYTAISEIPSAKQRLDIDRFFASMEHDFHLAGMHSIKSAAKTFGHLS